MSLNRARRNKEGVNTDIEVIIDISNNIGHALGFEWVVAFARSELEKVHRYVLLNYGLLVHKGRGLCFELFIIIFL